MVTARNKCDACLREDQRCDQISRGGMDIWICIDWRSCIAEMPPLSEILGQVASV